MTDNRFLSVAEVIRTKYLIMLHRFTKPRVNRKGQTCSFSSRLDPQ